MSLLVHLLRTSRVAVALSILAGVASGVSGVALLALVHAELGRERPSPERLAWAFAGLCLFGALTRAAAQASMVRLAQDSAARLSLHVCRRILALPLRRFEQIDPASLLAILTEDVVLVANAMGGIPVLSINLPIVLACFLYAGWLSPRLLLAGLVCAVPAIAGYQFLALRGVRSIRAARGEQDHLVGHFRSLIDGFRELKVHRRRREEFLSRCLETTTDSVRARATTGLSYFALAGGWSQLAFFGFLGMLLFVVGRDPHLDRQALSGAVLVVLFLMSPLEAILVWVPILGRAGASLQKIESRVPALPDPTSEELARGTINPPAFRDAIQLAGVTYGYPPERDGGGFVLGPVDLTLRRGELVFLTGGNGSGKTTFVKLLTGLYIPELGTIEVDGRPMGPDGWEGYRQLFGVVFADGHLFPDLLGVGREGLDARADALLTRLGLADLVRVEGGSFTTTRLSQGQRRRLALAAMFLEDRPVAVLDEWAAHQDPRWKEAFYYEILPELKASGKTVLVVTHDEEFFFLADRVLRCHEGRVAEGPSPAPTESDEPKYIPA